MVLCRMLLREFCHDYADGILKECHRLLDQNSGRIKAAPIADDADADAIAFLDHIFDPMVEFIMGSVYDFAGTHFLNSAGFQIMGYQSDITIQTLKQMVGALPNDMEHYGGMLVYPIEFDIVNFLTGAERTVTIIHFVKCECPKAKPRHDQCLEQRFFEQIIKETIVLPPAAVEYHRIIAKGLGDGPGGRGATDLIFVAYMKPDPDFKRKRADVISKVNVSLAEVILGKPIVIENFDGEKIDISTDDGIQDREEKRIKGHRLPLLIEPVKRGDFVVTIHIQFPEQLDPEQVKGIEELLPDDPTIYE
jgi:hypothetical protein